jgi:hypothetical protein
MAVSVEQAPDHGGLGGRELVLGHRGGGEGVELLERQLGRLARVLGPRPRADHEDARVLEALVVGEDAVTEPIALADRVEEPRRHAPTEDVRHHGQRGAVLIGGGDARHGEHEANLRLLLVGDRADVARVALTLSPHSGNARPRLGRGHVGEQLGGALRVEAGAAGDGKAHRLGGVEGAVIVEELVAGGLLDDRGEAGG